MRQNVTVRISGASRFGGGVAFTDQGAAFTVLVDTGGGIHFNTFTGTSITNSSLSGKSVRITYTYAIN